MVNSHHYRTWSLTCVSCSQKAHTAIILGQNPQRLNCPQKKELTVTFSEGKVTTLYSLSHKTFIICHLTLFYRERQRNVPESTMHALYVHLISCFLYFRFLFLFYFIYFVVLIYLSIVGFLIFFLPAGKISTCPLRK